MKNVVVTGSVKKLIINAHFYSGNPNGGEPDEQFKLDTWAEFDAKVNELERQDAAMEFFTEYSDGTEQSGVSPVNAGDPAYMLKCVQCGKPAWTVGTPRPEMYGDNYEARCITCMDEDPD